MPAIRDINSLKVSSLQPTQTPVDVTSEQESDSIMQNVHKNDGTLLFDVYLVQAGVPVLRPGYGDFPSRYHNI
jgi:hypothetical protein